jgi:hypothetical protein
MKIQPFIGIFYSISKKHSSFYDKSEILYKFRLLETDELSMLNMGKLYTESIENPVKVSQEICDLLIKILLIPHKKDNMSSVMKTRIFKKFVLLVTKLQKVDLFKMSEEERRIFFVNIHNVLLVHSYILFGFPKTQSEYEILLDKSYRIGSWPFSIRLMRNIALGHLPFHIPADLPRQYLDLQSDPLVHFCIFTGNNQSPCIRSYTKDDFEEMSEQQAQQYILDHVILSKEFKEVLLPRFFETYFKDFGGKKSEFIRNLSDYFDKQDREWLKSNSKDIVLLYKEPSFKEIYFIKESIVTKYIT